MSEQDELMTQRLVSTTNAFAQAMRERDEALAIIRQLVLVEAKRQTLKPGSTEMGIALLAWNNAQALLHRYGVLVVASPEAGRDAEVQP